MPRYQFIAPSPCSSLVSCDFVTVPLTLMLVSPMRGLSSCHWCLAAVCDGDGCTAPCLLAHVCDRLKEIILMGMVMIGMLSAGMVLVGMVVISVMLTTIFLIRMVLTGKKLSEEGVIDGCGYNRYFQLRSATLCITAVIMMSVLVAHHTGMLSWLCGYHVAGCVVIVWLAVWLSCGWLCGYRVAGCVVIVWLATIHR